MRAALAVKADIGLNGGTLFPVIALSTKIDLFIFDGLPKRLDEDVFPPSAFSVQANLDLADRQHFLTPLK